jgi:Predicted nucleotide-binding protein containing TIR-like domain
MGGKLPRARPAVFIGSSVEGLDVAYAIQENLHHDAEVTVWPQGVFDLTQTALKSLTKMLEKADFGIFVFTPDDRIRLRKKALSAVRDNVVFELGLFIGKLGVDRTFVVIPDDAKDLHIPTDLTGVTPGKFDPKRNDRNLSAALGPFCNRVRAALRKRNAVRTPVKSARQTVVSLAGIVIHSAMYGARMHRIDVRKALINELRRTGSAYIGNQLGGDPAPNTQKDLKLDFSFKRQRQQVEIPEGSSLTFPK